MDRYRLRPKRVTVKKTLKPCPEQYEKQCHEIKTFLAKLKVKIKKKRNVKKGSRHVKNKYVKPFISNIKYVEMLRFLEMLKFMKENLGITSKDTEIEKTRKELENVRKQNDKYQQREQKQQLERKEIDDALLEEIEEQQIYGYKLPPIPERKERKQDELSTSTHETSFTDRLLSGFSTVKNRLTPSKKPQTQSQPQSQPQSQTTTPMQQRRASNERPPIVARPDFDLKDNDEKTVQNASGMNKLPNAGLYSHQIDELMINHANYCGTFASDETDRLLDTIFKNGLQKFGAIINMDKSTLPGSHWVALYGDLVNEKEVNYYDSLAGKIPPFIKSFFLKLIQRAQVPYLLKLKNNLCRDQRINSNTCGLHSVEFLQQRLMGHPFRECSGYDILKQEQKIKKKFGYI